MKRVQALWLLAAINVLLLAALCFKYNLAETPAHAQRAIGRGGDYVLLPAKNNVNPNGVVYMLDTRNARLIRLHIRWPRRPTDAPHRPGAGLPNRPRPKPLTPPERRPDHEKN